MFVIVQNDRHCPPGSLLRFLASAGQRFGCVASYAGEPLPDPAHLAGAIVLGGEMAVHETERFPHLDRVQAFMARALAAGTPLLGICLGGQLLAKLAGGAVASPSRFAERGVGRVSLTPAGASDPLFTGVPTPFVTFQLHDDSFSLPPGGILLAESAACPAQAFRLGANAYGVQFHPEVDRAIVDCWDRLACPSQELSSGFAASQNAFDAASHAILANFVSLAVASCPP